MEEKQALKKNNEEKAKSKKSVFAIIFSSLGILISVIFSIFGTSYSNGLLLVSIGICSVIYFVTKIVPKKKALSALRIVGISICAVSLIFAFIGFSDGDSYAAGSILFFIFFALLFGIDLLK